QQHPALFLQLGTAFWYLQVFNKLEDPCYVTTDYEAAARRLGTLTRYRAHYERLFYQAMCLLDLLIANCTNKPKELSETILRIHRRTNENSLGKANRIQSQSSNPYRPFPKPDTHSLMHPHCHRRNPRQTKRMSPPSYAATQMPLGGLS
ncbi:MAG: hypothetical protein ABJF23_34850, partial [Bryobacteraceae bacterium]